MGIQRKRRSSTANVGAEQKVDEDQMAVKLDNLRQDTISRARELNNIVQSLDAEDLLLINDTMQKHDNLYDFFRDYSSQHDYNILIATGIISQQEAELFKYYDSHNLTNDVKNGVVDIYNHDAIELDRSRFAEWLDKNPKYNNDNGDIGRTIKLPNIYLLAGERTLQLFQAMSLNANIKLLSTLEDMKVFEKDDDEKVVIYSDGANGDLSDAYSNVLAVQRDRFKRYKALKDDSMNKNNVIWPITRDNVINRLLEGMD